MVKIVLQKKSLYCFECGKTTPHSYVGKESMYEGTGIARVVAAIASLDVGNIVGGQVLAV